MRRAKRFIEKTEIVAGSGNVFADLGLSDAEKLKIKSGLVIEITRATRKVGLTQEEAGRRMGILQPKVSAMLRGVFLMVFLLVSGKIDRRKLIEINRL